MQTSDAKALFACIVWLHFFVHSVGNWSFYKLKQIAFELKLNYMSFFIVIYMNLCLKRRKKKSNNVQYFIPKMFITGEKKYIPIPSKVDSPKSFKIVHTGNQEIINGEVYWSGNSSSPYFLWIWLWCIPFSHSPSKDLSRHFGKIAWEKYSRGDD